MDSLSNIDQLTIIVINIAIVAIYVADQNLSLQG